MQNSQADSAPTPWSRFRAGARYGLLIGVLLLGVGLVRIVFVLLRGGRFNAVAWGDLALACGYVLAFALAGGIISLLARWRSSRLGALALGYVGAGIVSVAIGVLMQAREGHFDPAELAPVTGIMTLVFGTMVGYQLGRPS